MLIRRCFHSCKIVNATNRLPLIKFIGKRSNVKVNNTAISSSKPQSSNNTIRSTVSSTSSSLSSSTTTKQSSPSINIKGTSIPGSGVDFRTLKGGAMFGRPAITLKEMEEIESGGASSF